MWCGQLGVTSLKLNIIANFAGRLWSAVLTLALVRVQVNLLGLEAYGLISLFASLQAVLGLLDMGLTPTTNREVARCMARPETAGGARSVVRTFEVPYWGVGVVIGVGLAAASNRIAHSWLDFEHLTIATVQSAFMIMAFSAAIRWPVSLYSGALQGMQLQVLVNALVIGVATLRGLGSVLVLLLISPTIKAFLFWQVVASLVEVSAYAWLCHRRLPRVSSQFDFGILRRTWRYSAGMSYITLTVIILTQADRFLLSRLLPLEQLGYYATASVAAGLLAVISVAVSVAVFPRLTAAIAAHEDGLLLTTYQRGARLISYLATCVAAVLIFFPSDILLLWTDSEVVAQQAALPLALLAISGLLSSFSALPYQVSLAVGLPQVGATVNTLSIVLVIPLMLLLIPMWGTAGAAVAMVTLGVASCVLTPTLAVRRGVHIQAKSWLMQDILPYLLLGGVIFGLARLTIVAFLSSSVYPVIGSAICVYLAIGGIFVPDVREAIARLRGRSFATEVPVER